MSSVIDNFLERPTSHKVGFWVLTIGFLGFLFWQYMYSAKLEERTELETSVEELNAKITHERRLARNLKRFREEVKDLDIKLKFALQELPDKREIPDLLSAISNLARDAGLEVSLFKPKPENLKEFYAEVPVDISVSGTFHQVATFFDEVGNLSRIVNIDAIAIKEPKVKPELIEIKADCVGTTFRYLDESERKLAKEKAKAGDKRRRR